MINAIDLRNKKELKRIDNKPGYYKWWANKSELKFILDKLSVKFETVESAIEEKVDSLSNKGKNAAITRKHGYKINTKAREAMQKAEETMQTIEKDMKEASAKLAAEQANRIIE